MKYKIKKFIMPLILIVLGTIVAIFISVFNPKTINNDTKFSNKYIEVKIKNIYPFSLLFKKGVSVKYILRKLNIGAREIYLGNSKIDFDTKLYEDSTLKIS